jgi:hypothetical protein
MESNFLGDEWLQNVTKKYNEVLETNSTVDQNDVTLFLTVLNLKVIKID